MSLRAIGSKIKKRYGYSSTESAAMALQSGFERLHLERRNHVELMRQRNRKHGRYEADRNMARRYRRRETGEVRDVRCEGVRQNYPDKGARCSRPALNGSTFCWAHDPVGKADRDQHLKSMRAQADK
jgi:hypothetical protein